MANDDTLLPRLRRPRRSAEPGGAAAPARAVPAGATLYRDIRNVLTTARQQAHRSVNRAMVESYWHVGRLIVEHEQAGRRRAKYGERLLDGLSARLTTEFGRGFTTTNLRYMRQFFLAFPIHHAPRDESRRMKPGAPARSRPPEVPDTVRPELTWTHYRLLLGIDDAAARAWYLAEAVEQHWSTRQLERQIGVLYYEQLLASRDGRQVRKEAKRKLAALRPEQFLRDPYVLEFLDLPDRAALRESTVEQAILDNLQEFLLELGKGFCFVARQKRVRFEEEDFYLDLVFYNYMLRCFVLIDLKVGRLTHQDIGQMDSYVRVFDAHARLPGDNPTIGLILCSQKNEAIARYSVLSEAKQVFAAKYTRILPTESQLSRAVARERRRYETMVREGTGGA